jgi:acylphosphatase
VLVHGRVQGVFFRETIRRAAEQHDLAGWVRNCPDGTVEAAFEGDDDAVERLVEFAQRGPSDAEVERVDVYEETPEGLTGFAVR